MARRSLKPQLNQIRTWVREGRTDAWIAHQLEVTVKDIAAFKRDHELAPDDAGDDEAGGPRPVLDEPDLRAEDDALVAAELDAELEEAAEEGPEAEAEVEPDANGSGAGEGDGERPRRRRRGRRGGRGRRRGGGKRELEGTFDHGAEGYGLWLDPAVQDNPIYAEHWAGHRPVTITFEPDRIVITRAGEASGGDETD